MYEEEPYPKDPKTSAIREDLTAGTNHPRVLRGGSWHLNAFNMRCAYRYRDSPGDGDDYFGFRVVASPFSSR